MMAMGNSGSLRFGRIACALAVAALGSLCLLATAPVHSQPPEPRLTSDSEVASAGYFQLSWETPAGDVELQEATIRDFRNPTTFYRGPDRAAVISGKPDGTWYYRVRAWNNSQQGPWSEPVTVVVSHHSLSRAVWFLCVGIVVFVATVLMIVRGSEKAR